MLLSYLISLYFSKLKQRPDNWVLKINVEVNLPASLILCSKWRQTVIRKHALVWAWGTVLYVSLECPVSMRDCKMSRYRSFGSKQRQSAFRCWAFQPDDISRPAGILFYVLEHANPLLLSYPSGVQAVWGQLYITHFTTSVQFWNGDRFDFRCYVQIKAPEHSNT